MLEAVKIVIFVAFFVLFLVVARNLFSVKSTYGTGDTSASNIGPAEPGFVPLERIDDGRNQPVLVGAELPFPVSLPPRQAYPDGKYNRPVVRNYYFRKLDLVHGPDDPRCFCDEFFIQFEEPEMESVWTNEYIVATPAGLQQLLDSGKHDSLQFDGMLIVVPKWNLADLLKIIMDEVIEGYGASRTHKESSKKKEAQRYWS